MTSPLNVGMTWNQATPSRVAGITGDGDRRIQRAVEVAIDVLHLLHRVEVGRHHARRGFTREAVEARRRRR